MTLAGNSIVKQSMAVCIALCSVLSVVSCDKKQESTKEVDAHHTQETDVPDVDNNEDNSTLNKSDSITDSIDGQIVANKKDSHLSDKELSVGSNQHNNADLDSINNLNNDHSNIIGDENTPNNSTQHSSANDSSTIDKRTKHSLSENTTKLNEASNEALNSKAAKSAVSTPNPVTAPLVDCDDQVAITQLIQIVRADIRGKSNKTINHYLERTDIEKELADTDASVSSMLIDLANIKRISEPNIRSKDSGGSGLVTCNASLSITLPTKDVYRTKEVYNALNGVSLNRRLQAQNISMTNNMLVTKNFPYVVGLKSGQTFTRMVGEPPIINAIADIVSKSQFKAAVDAKRPALTETHTEKPAKPVQPTQPIEPIQPTPSAKTPESKPAKLKGDDNVSPSSSQESDDTLSNSNTSLDINDVSKKLKIVIDNRSIDNASKNTATTNSTPDYKR